MFSTATRVDIFPIAATTKETYANSDRRCVHLSSEIMSDSLPLEAPIRPKHRIISADEWLGWTPPSLFDLCIEVIVRRLSDTIAEVDSATTNAAGTGTLLRLRQGIRLDARTCDALCRRFVELRKSDDFRASRSTLSNNISNFDSSFFNIFVASPARTSLTTAELECYCSDDTWIAALLLERCRSLRHVALSTRHLGGARLVKALNTTESHLSSLHLKGLDGSIAQYFNQLVADKPATALDMTSEALDDPEAAATPREQLDRAVQLLSPARANGVTALSLTPSSSSELESYQRDLSVLLGAFPYLRHVKIAGVADCTNLLVRFCTTLSTLDLHDCSLTDEDFRTIATFGELR